MANLDVCPEPHLDALLRVGDSKTGCKLVVVKVRETDVGIHSAKSMRLHRSLAVFCL